MWRIKSGNREVRENYTNNNNIIIYYVQYFIFYIPNIPIPMLY